MKPANSIIASYGTTFFETMSRLADANSAVNLGQGFPDGPGPESVLAAARDAIANQSNQYPPMPGLPALRKAVAAHDARFYGLTLDWESEVLVTSGATEALAAAFFGLIEPGDEVVVLEPLYDSYVPIIRRAGGVPRPVRLMPPDWALPYDALAQAFGPKTKLLVLNNPMNPTGKVFTRAELTFLAGLVARYDAIAVCDEVYEHIVFDGRAHIPMMTLPGMRARCLRIASAGKTFSLTGWKVGYVSAPAALLGPVRKTHQFLTFTTPPNLQHAAAHGLGLEDAYFAGLASGMQAKRDHLGQGLAKLGLPVLDCGGAYFLNADFSGFAGEGEARLREDDMDMARRLTIEAGVTTIPASAFYLDPPALGVLRFTFCKDEAVLDEALARLGRSLARTRRAALA